MFLAGPTENLLRANPQTRYIAPVIKRILSVLLVAWIAIAPAIANSCAAGCDTGAASMHHPANESVDRNASDVPDCHGDANQRDNSNMPEGGSMVVACFVASAASLPSSSISVVKIEVASEQRSSVLLPPLSFQTSAPARPPQA